VPKRFRLSLAGEPPGKTYYAACMLVANPRRVGIVCVCAPGVRAMHEGMWCVHSVCMCECVCSCVCTGDEGHALGQCMRACGVGVGCVCTAACTGNA
jgi:hypothetical protein